MKIKATTAVLALILGVVLLASCNDHDSPTRATTGTSDLWTVSIAKVSIEGADDCLAGNLFGSWEASVYIGGAGTVDFTLDPSNCPTDCVPFNGTIQGDAFTASTDLSFTPSTACGHLQATGVLTGTFSPDRRTLTATEVDTYTEPSGHQIVVRSTWTGSKKS